MIDFADAAKRLMEICPNCGGNLFGPTCHMWYSTWDCMGCGALIDGRVAHPKLVLRCDNEWPDYKRGIVDPVHPIACSCSGRGWYELESV